MTIGDLDLERIAARGWRAQHEAWLGEWLLRANDGFTGRANSVLPLGDPGGDLDPALDEVAAWYGDHELPTRFTVPSPSRDDLRQALEARGWHPTWGAHVMVAALDDIATPDQPRVDIQPFPSLEWQGAYRRGTGRLPPAGRRLLVRADVVGFAQIVHDDEVVGIARGTVVEGWLGVTAVEVVPSHRRRGLATRLLGGLTEWGRARGATHSYLQVALDNDVARAMYRRAGFGDHHSYAYFSPPA